jgi:hypothetical protein
MVKHPRGLVIVKDLLRPSTSKNLAWLQRRGVLFVVKQDLRNARGMTGVRVSATSGVDRLVDWVLQEKALLASVQG